MDTVVYQIRASNTGDATNAANIAIVRDGILRGVVVEASLLAAGSVFAHVELAMNATGLNSTDTNDPERHLLLAGATIAGITSAASYQMNSGFIPVNRRVKIGDVISHNQTLTGTTPTGLETRWQLYVEES